MYGWWSINQLLTDDIVCKEEGEYNVIRYYNSFVKIKDNYEMDHYHFNCHKASDLILKEYKKKNQCSVFLYGNPGLGKTTTARLLSKKLNATLCLDFEEFSHIRNSFVNSFELLYNYVQPTVQNPLIITIDELESFLLETNKGGDEYYGDRGERIQYRLKYKNIKKNWVRLMDTVQEKKFVVFVLTTNKTKEFFDELDPALLREYRINQCIHYTNDGVDMVPFQGKKKKKTI